MNGGRAGAGPEAVGASEEEIVVVTSTPAEGATSKNLGSLGFLCSETVPMKKNIIHVLGCSEDQREPSC